jgi:hypothetical protein
MRQGRFVSRDVWPVDFGDPWELNRYGYTGGNPVRWTDPTGWNFAEFNKTLQANTPYRIVFGTSVGMITGMAVAGIYSNWIFDMVTEGRCGRESASAIEGLTREEFVRASVLSGALFGGVFGFVAATGNIGAVTAGVIGVGFGAHSIGSSVVRLIETAITEHKFDQCAAFDLALGLASTGLSVLGIRGALLKINQPWARGILTNLFGEEYVTVFRFCNVADPNTMRPKLSFANVLEEGQWALMRWIRQYELFRANNHAEGRRINSPFVSLFTDESSILNTRDAWVSTITTGAPGSPPSAPVVRQAPHIATFLVPRSRLAFLTNQISTGETEVLFVGDDLISFLIGHIDNPHQPGANPNFPIVKFPPNP